MSRTIHVTKPVVLEGFQAILKPSQYGYTLSAHFTNQEMMEHLEADRETCLEWAKSKLKNAKRCVIRPEPWEESEIGAGYKVKFTWKEGAEPPIVDSEGTPITDTSLPLYSGSKVRIGFYQKPYTLKDNVTIGTRLVIAGIQVVSISSGSAMDSGPADASSAAAMFGKIDGFRLNEANVRTAEEPEEAEALPF